MTRTKSVAERSYLLPTFRLLLNNAHSTSAPANKGNERDSTLVPSGRSAESWYVPEKLCSSNCMRRVPCGGTVPSTRRAPCDEVNRIVTSLSGRRLLLTVTVTVSPCVSRPPPPVAHAAPSSSVATERKRQTRRNRITRQVQGFGSLALRGLCRCVPTSGILVLVCRSVVPYSSRPGTGCPLNVSMFG